MQSAVNALVLFVIFMTILIFLVKVPNECNGFYPLLIFLFYIVFFQLIESLFAINNDRTQENMTLKTDCDERDRNCTISCTTADGKFNNKCFDVCKMNSPIC